MTKRRFGYPMFQASSCGSCLLSFHNFGEHASAPEMQIWLLETAITCAILKADIWSFEVPRRPVFLQSGICLGRCPHTARAFASKLDGSPTRLLADNTCMLESSARPAMKSYKKLTSLEQG